MENLPSISVVTPTWGLPYSGRRRQLMVPHFRPVTIPFTVTCAFANNGKIKAKSSVNEKMGILFIIVIIWFE